jgi:hypothetical protein
MHRILAPLPHAVIDYALVVVLFLAPTWFAFGGVAASISYLLAIVHLGLSLITAYPLGIWRMVPFPAHGQLELIVGCTLAIAPLFLPFEGDDKARFCFIALGLLIIGVYALTNYRGTTFEPNRNQEVPS